MGMDLERIVKTRAFRACMAGLAALALTASVQMSSFVGLSYVMRKGVAQVVHLNYVTTDAINDQIGEFLGNDIMWESIQPDYDDYSTLDLVEKESRRVHVAIDQYTDDSINKIDLFADKYDLKCGEYTFLTYKGLISLFKEHPELRPHLKNIRIGVGLTSNGRIESGHAWLEVKVDDEWQTYDTIDENANLPGIREMLSYNAWAHFSMRDDGSIEKTVHSLNIFIHPLDFTKYAFNALEDRVDSELMNRPYTNLVDDFVTFPAITLTMYGMLELAWAGLRRKVLDETRWLHG